MKSGTTVRESTVPAVFELDKRLSEGTTASEQQRKALEGGGHELFEQGAFEAAARTFTDALPLISLSDRPTRSTVLLNRGLAFLSNRQAEQAMWDAEAALALGGSREKAMYIRGMAKKLQGNHVEAASDLSACLALLSNDAERRHVEKILKEVKEQPTEENSTFMWRLFLALIHLALLSFILHAGFDHWLSSLVVLLPASYFWIFGLDHFQALLSPTPERRLLPRAWALFYLSKALGASAALAVLWRQCGAGRGEGCF